MTDQAKEQEKIDMILKAMEQAAEDQRKAIAFSNSTFWGKRASLDEQLKRLKHANEHDAQEPNKIYWKG